jgi:hypothetical protein
LLIVALVYEIDDLQVTGHFSEFGNVDAAIQLRDKLVEALQQIAAFSTFNENYVCDAFFATAQVTDAA